MAKISGMVLAGIVAFVTGSQSLLAQIERRPPLYVCGVANDQSLFQTVQGPTYTFAADERPSVEQMEQISSLLSPSATLVTSADGNQNVVSMFGFPTNGGFAEPTHFYFGGISLWNGTTAVAGQEFNVIIFSTAEHRDGFLYYIQQREAAATDIDYDYFTTWSEYEYWMGQEVEHLALYRLYFGLGSYYGATTPDPKLAEFYRNYYLGLAVYYYYDYYDRLNGTDYADMGWAFFYQLALQALE